TLNLALGFLFGGLREARMQFVQQGDNGRLGAIRALGAFWQFILLFRMPLAQALHLPIVRLQDALTMLNYNKIEPILERVPHRGRAPSSYSYDCLKGTAVATAQHLVQVGVAREDAQRAVAAQLRKRHVRPERGSGTVTRTTVKNWSYEIS